MSASSEEKFYERTIFSVKFKFENNMKNFPKVFQEDQVALLPVSSFFFFTL